jgi:hypothetical protein
LLIENTRALEINNQQSTISNFSSHPRPTPVSLETVVAGR